MTTEPQEPRHESCTTCGSRWPFRLDLDYPNAPFGTVILLDGQKWLRGDAQWVPSPVAQEPPAPKWACPLAISDGTVTHHCSCGGHNPTHPAPAWRCATCGHPDGLHDNLNGACAKCSCGAFVAPGSAQEQADPPPGLPLTSLSHDEWFAS